MSSGAGGGGVGREWPSQSDGFAPGAGSRCQRRPGWAASRLCAPRAASRLPRPEPLPGRAKGGAAAGAERPAPGVRGQLERRPRRRPVPGAAPGHGGAARRRAAGPRAPGPAAERRSPRPERAGKQLGHREPDERPDAVPGSSGPRRAAPAASRGLPQPFRSDCPRSLPLPLPLPRGLPPPCARARPPPPPSLPPSLFPSLPPPGLSLLPSLPSPHSGLLSRAHTFFLAHARRHISASLRARPRSPSLPLSLSLLPALQPFKMLPLPCDSPAAAPRPPARSPAPSLARFLSLALPLPTSDLLH